LNGPAAGGETLGFTLTLTDSGDRFAVRIENAVLHHRAGEGGPGVALSRGDLVDLVTGAKTVADLGLRGEGAEALARLVGLLDRFDLWFEISAP
jgi:alkyl sulfatase BDS1-like metallo-beta-lactamase superfamily hydrolase